jgi:hypothetical protein
MTGQPIGRRVTHLIGASGTLLPALVNAALAGTDPFP